MADSDTDSYAAKKHARLTDELARLHSYAARDAKIREIDALTRSILAAEKFAVLDESRIRETEAAARLTLITGSRARTNQEAMSRDDSHREAERLAELNRSAHDGTTNRHLLVLDEIDRQARSARKSDELLSHRGGCADVVTKDHAPAFWQPSNLRNRLPHEELMAIARARVIVPSAKRLQDQARHEAAMRNGAKVNKRKILASDAKPNLGRSNKKRKPERVESLHTEDGRQRLANLEGLVFAELSDAKAARLADFAELSPA